MRQKTMFAERPDEIEVVPAGGGNAVVFFRENIEEVPVEDGVAFSADVYELDVIPANGLIDRITANKDAWLAKAKELDYEKAAAAVREQRNNLLNASDKDLCLDRLNLETPSGTTFASWKPFLEKFAEAANGEIADYRQALRDVPQQAGFPYDVEWPVKP